MSDLNEEFLIDDDGDGPDVTEADEEALLQDDEDILSLVPEEDLNESLDESRNTLTDLEGKRNDRQKFASERARITAPESIAQLPKKNTDKYKQGKRQNLRNGRGVMVGRRFFNRSHHQGKNKTVLINPRFQGVVHVNNNARLAWDHTQGLPQQHHPINPWLSNVGPPNMGPHMQPTAGMQNIPPMLEPFHHMNGPGLQYIPPLQQPFLPPGPPQSHLHSMQGPQPPWGCQMHEPPPPGPDHTFMPNNYQQPSPIIINTSQPPPQIPPPNSYPHHLMNQPSNPNFFPPHGPHFDNNNKHFNQGQNMKLPKRKLGPGNFGVHTKRFVKDRLGHVPPQHVPKVEERIPVVTEVKVTNVTTVKMEEDEETKDLRYKIEEQKRKREAILKWKEQRRLETANLRENPVQPQEPLGIGQSAHQVESPPFKGKKQNNNIVITNGYSKRFTKYQKNAKPEHLKESQTVPQTEVKKEEPDLELDEKYVQSFLTDRKVLIKDEALLSTRKVVIKNISTSTGDKKIFQICKNVGEVQKLQRDKNERQATITFTSVAQAHAFFKKYQRYMLDLSMVEVSLSPMTESDQN